MLTFEYNGNLVWAYLGDLTFGVIPWLCMPTALTASTVIFRQIVDEIGSPVIALGAQTVHLIPHRTTLVLTGPVYATVCSTAQTMAMSWAVVKYYNTTYIFWIFCSSDKTLKRHCHFFFCI